MDKLDERYKKLALEAKVWIEAITGRSFGDGDFIEELSDGVMLCRLMKKLLPGSVKSINKSKMPFARRENISCALRACRAFGQTEFEMFETEDLASFKNVTQVVSALHSLGRTVQEKRPDIEHTLGLKVKKGVVRVAKTVERWKEFKDPTGRSFWVSEELGLSSWSKPSTTEFPLTNLPNWREMVNPDGKRFAFNTKTKETMWDENEANGEADSAAKPPAQAVAPPPVPSGAGGAGAGTSTDDTTNGSATKAGADGGGDASAAKDEAAKPGDDASAAAATDPDALHADWEEVPMDDGSGTVYYRHKTTYETQWDKPTVGGSAGAAAGGDGDLDPEWEEVPMDDGSGAVYYRHKTTFETTWEKPVAGAAAEPLPEGWIAVDSADGTYYENTATGESQWEKPTA